MNQLEPNGFRFYCPKSSPAMAFMASASMGFNKTTHFERIKQIFSHFSERIIYGSTRFSERINRSMPHFSFAFPKKSLILGRKTKRKAYGITRRKAQ